VAPLVGLLPLALFGLLVFWLLWYEVDVEPASPAWLLWATPGFPVLLWSLHRLMTGLDGTVRADEALAIGLLADLRNG
jgi:hypothetical protein